MKKASLVASVLLTYAMSAWGDTPQVEDAKRYFKAGAAAFAVGQFTAASHAFTRSYELSPRDGTLFSLAQSERRQFYVDRDPEHLRVAIDAFRRYVARVEQAGRRVEAVDALAELEPLYDKLANEPEPTPAAQAPAPATRLMVTSRDGSTIVLDGRVRADAPFIRDVGPGRHRVVVSAPGFFPEQREIETKEGSFAVLDVTLRERPASLVVHGPRGCDVFVDGVPKGTTPLGAIAVPAGRHWVSVVRAGDEPWSSHVLLQPGDSTPLAPQMRTSVQRKTAWISMGLGGASLLAAATFAGLSLERQSYAQSINETRSSGNISTADIQDYQSAQRARDRWRTAAQFTAVGSGVLWAVGAALFVMDRPPPPSDVPLPSNAPVSPPERSLEPSFAGLAGGGGKIGLQGTF